jgi:hypothetical protein
VTLRLVAVAALAVVFAAPARAAQPCGEALFNDWLDGRIDGAYAPHCYRQALESLPEDVQTYSTAREDLERALLSRLRQDWSAQDRSLLGVDSARAGGHEAASESAASSSGWSASTAALIAGALVVAAIAIALLFRRRRSA